MTTEELKKMLFECNMETEAKAEIDEIIQVYEKKLQPCRVVITMKGGLIHDIDPDHPLQAVIIDHDIEMCSDEEMVSLTDTDGSTFQAYKYFYPIKEYPQDRHSKIVNHFFNQAQAFCDEELKTGTNG